MKKKCTRSVCAVLLALAICLIPGLVLALDSLSLDFTISVDGGTTWDEYSTAPGAIATEGQEISFQGTLTNTGDTAFDYMLIDPTGFVYAASLAPTLSTGFTGSVLALVGEQSLIASVTASGIAGETPFELSASDTAYYYGIPLPTQILVDIKPGSDPNSINLGSHGVTPVAILSEEDGFDATTLDGSIVTFAGALAQHWAIEDVNEDGIMDMILHFRTQELALDGDSTEASIEISGFDEVADQDVVTFSGTDSVNIVPQGNAYGQDNGGGNGNAYAYGQDNGNNGGGNAYGHSK
jgi:hypothetical protein